MTNVKMPKDGFMLIIPKELNDEIEGILYDLGKYGVNIDKQSAIIMALHFARTQLKGNIESFFKIHQYYQTTTSSLGTAQFPTGITGGGFTLE